MQMTPQEMVDALNDPKKTEFSDYFYLNKHIDNDQLDEASKHIQSIFKCSREAAEETLVLYKEQVYAKVKEVRERNKLSPEQIAYNNAVARSWQNKPKCPTCGSTDIKSISGLNRGVSVAVLGMFSKKINKSFECKHCGYTW
ncbi:MAG: transposase [Acetatifactor sp.]|nr:transposase [Acetatifactor sp.]